MVRKLCQNLLLRLSLYPEHIWVACQAKKKVLFVIQKLKNFIIFLQFSVGKASYFCVHAINFGPIIMSNFTFEAIFIPWTYLSRVPGKKNFIFLMQKLKKNLVWQSTKICSRYKDGLKSVFWHHYYTKIDDMYTKIRSFSKGKLQKNYEIFEFFWKKWKFFFLLGTLLKYVLGIKMTSKMNFDILHMSLHTFLLSSRTI